MANGKTVAERIRPGATGGIPWSVFLDANGNKVIDSDGPEGNIGCPVRPHEVAHFMTMLKTARGKLSDDELETIHKALKDYAKKLGG